MRIAVLPSDCLFYFLDTLLLHVPVSSQRTMPGRTRGNTWPSPTGCSRSTQWMCLRTYNLMKDFTSWRIRTWLRGGNSNGVLQAPQYCSNYSWLNLPSLVCLAVFWPIQHYVLGCNASLYKGHFSYEVDYVLDIVMSCITEYGWPGNSTLRVALQWNLLPTLSWAAYNFGLCDIVE